MKTIIMLIMSSFIMMTTVAYSQTILHFNYDDAGNRTSRWIEMKKTTLAESDSLEITPLSDQIDQIIIKIYPNPSKGLITVDISNLPENVPASLSICNIEGKSLEYIDVQMPSNHFDLSSFPNGIYVLRVTAGTNKAEWKIVKE